MILYRTTGGTVVAQDDAFYQLPDMPWDSLFTHDDLHAFLLSQIKSLQPITDHSRETVNMLAPIGSQEVWAAGVTYLRSRSARMEESQSAAGGDFYDRVYDAARPELFFKATAHRVVGPGRAVRIRRDSKWNVPEPELTLAISAGGRIIGYTIGNDMSSRDIEGENPLYLPQAKVYDGCCALGPGILVTDRALPGETQIVLTIHRDEQVVFQGSTTLSAMNRSPAELVDYLFRECSFPSGCFLMTGTGVVPPNDFTLAVGDRIEIRIDPIGTLVNVVE